MADHASFTAPELVLEEGWADKESRHIGTWRKRWLVLFTDSRTQLPCLCTFKEPRNAWDPYAPPRPTERVLLVGATCMIVAARGPGRDHVFWVRTREGDFFFSTESAEVCRRWVFTLSTSIAEAALRIGGAREQALALRRGAGHSPLVSTPSSVFSSVNGSPDLHAEHSAGARSTPASAGADAREATLARLYEEALAQKQAATDEALGALEQAEAARAVAAEAVGRRRALELAADEVMLQRERLEVALRVAEQDRASEGARQEREGAPDASDASAQRAEMQSAHDAAIAELKAERDAAVAAAADALATRREAERQAAEAAAAEAAAVEAARVAQQKRDAAVAAADASCHELLATRQPPFSLHSPRGSPDGAAAPPEGAELEDGGYGVLCPQDRLRLTGTSRPSPRSAPLDGGERIAEAAVAHSAPKGAGGERDRHAGRDSDLDDEYGAVPREDRPTYKQLLQENRQLRASLGDVQLQQLVMQSEAVSALQAEVKAHLAEVREAKAAVRARKHQVRSARLSMCTPPEREEHEMAPHGDDREALPNGEGGNKEGEERQDVDGEGGVGAGREEKAEIGGGPTECRSRQVSCGSPERISARSRQTSAGTSHEALRRVGSGVRTPSARSDDDWAHPDDEEAMEVLAELAELDSEEAELRDRLRYLTLQGHILDDSMAQLSMRPPSPDSPSGADEAYVPFQG